MANQLMMQRKVSVNLHYDDNNCTSQNDFNDKQSFLLTFTGGRRFQCPQLFLLQACAVGIQLEPERLRRHVFMLGIYQADRPPAFLLIL